VDNDTKEADAKAAFEELCKSLPGSIGKEVSTQLSISMLIMIIILQCMEIENNFGPFWDLVKEEVVSTCTIGYYISANA